MVGLWFVFGMFWDISRRMYFWVIFQNHLGSIQQDFNSNDAFPLLEEYSLSAKNDGV